MKEKEQNSTDLERVDCHLRIEKLKQRLREIAGDEVRLGCSHDCPPEVFERFLQQVIAYEEQELDTDFNRLTTAGISLPPPEELDDDGLTGKLWQVIHALARQEVFLEHTDHLSDRELYSRLWSRSLREKSPSMAGHGHGVTHLDLLGGWSEEDVELHLKYYADELDREHWQSEFPDYELPTRCDPPYDRDRHLPQPDW